MKVLYRNTLVWNLVLFIIFSFALVHVATAITSDQSAFNHALVQDTVINHVWGVILLALTGLMIFRLNKFSVFLFPSAIIFVIGICSSMLIMNFNKILLILMFIYIIVAYFYYQFLKVELGESYNNPNYSKNRLFDPMLYKVTCKITSLRPSNNEFIVTGHLTNWNENGCFVMLDQNLKLRGKVELTLELDGKEFSNVGLVVASINNNEGIGIKFYDESNSIYNWYNFHKIIEEKGLLPEYVG